MEYNETLYNDFIQFVVTSLEDLKKETLSNIEQSSLLKYGTTKDKIQALEDLKNDCVTGHFNHLRVKGVSYHQGEIKIVENELQEIIKECGVNLKHKKFGLFCNEFDKEKPIAYKSYSQAYFQLSYCLQLQIINEEISKIHEPEKKAIKEKEKSDLIKEPYNKQYLTLFIPWGFELFQFLDKNFEGEKFVEPRYSILFLFLKRECKVLKSEMVKSHYTVMVKKETKIKKKFSRLSTTIDADHYRYKNNLPELIKIFKDFKAEFENPFE